MKRTLWLLALLSLPASLPACGGSTKSMTVGTPSSAAALMLHNLQLVSDDDGTLPADNAQVVLLFEPGGVVDLYRPTDTSIDARQGQYTYDGTTLSLQFTASDFQASANLTIDLSQPTITLPFRALSTAAGSSTWQVNTGPVASNLFMVAATALAAGAASIDDALDAAVAYGQALVPGKADNAWPAGAAIVTSVTRTDGVITICYEFATCINVRLFPDSYSTSVQPVVMESPIVTSDALNELMLPNGVPSPGDATDDPLSKNALVILPLKSVKHLRWNSYPGQVIAHTLDLTSWNDDLKSHTVGLADWPSGFNYDDIETVLGGLGFNVVELADANATMVNIINSVAPTTPGIFYMDSHGNSDGELLTSDIFPIPTSTFQSAVVWQAKVDEFAKTLEPISSDLVAKNSDGTYVMFDSELTFEDPRSGTIGTGAVAATLMTIYVKPAFWRWLREKKGANFSRSLVYIGGCDTDDPPAGTPTAQFLRNAFRARAYFAWATAMNYASANVFLYVIQHLSRHTHTAEEAYYNVLRILRVGQWVFEEDRVLDQLGTLPCKRNDPATDPCKLGNRQGLAINFHGYASDGSSDPINYLDGGWLTDTSTSDPNRNPGNIWWLMFKARWFTASGPVKSLSDCWDAWWSKMMTGGVGDTCQQEAPGVPPVQKELGVAAYMMTGSTAPFPDLPDLLPRWTLNDGASP